MFHAPGFGLSCPSGKRQVTENEPGKADTADKKGYRDIPQGIPPAPGMPAQATPASVPGSPDMDFLIF